MSAVDGMVGNALPASIPVRVGDVARGCNAAVFEPGIFPTRENFAKFEYVPAAAATSIALADVSNANGAGTTRAYYVRDVFNCETLSVTAFCAIAGDKIAVSAPDQLLRGVAALRKRAAIDHLHFDLHLARMILPSAAMRCD